MWQELEEEFKLFLEDMKKNSTICEYIDETHYEDEYSHNEIEECQSNFIKKVKGWLHENKPGQYVVGNGWCVLVLTIEEAKKRNFYNYEQRIVY